MEVDITVSFMTEKSAQGDTNWHSDGYATRPVISIKIAFYLDKLTSTTGALRVIPGSHKIGDKFGLSLEEYVKDTETTLGMDPSEVPSQVLEITPGDIVVFNHSIKHASFGGSSRRRMFTMNFSERYPDDKIDDLREQLGSESRFWIDRIHGEEMIRTASPERWVHLEQVRANDTHLAELTMDPPLALRIAGITYLVPRNAPLAFVLITSSHSSMDVFSIVVVRYMLALLTSTFSALNLCKVCWIASTQSFSEDTSSFTNVALPPLEEIS